MGIYAVRQVNRIDTHIPPMKNAIQSRANDLLEVLAVSFADKITGLT
eukprot:CAMPEP_0172398216 /NCGR_PEP_ID=MMETSP1061-20121228/34701_1 /TAXON_ID=37318 /ORGANISM="Pseudo-nitzschia pungens, Strain cf. pungens" /LENGTH=46 /DNA_ID= /DNA_START= /DNA_END= /DNA_ORIENTATION=